jgi:hypothetical protein
MPSMRRYREYQFYWDGQFSLIDILWGLIVSRPSIVFGGWVAMLNHAVEILDHGCNYLIQLIIRTTYLRI